MVLIEHGQIPAEPITGAQALVLSLEKSAVEVVFGIPGGTITPAYTALTASGAMRLVLARTDHAAGQAALGYAKASGRVGVCVVAAAPGAVNLISAIADAHADSVPLVVITGQQSRSLIGTDAFQEVDITGITMPITKHNMLVTETVEIPQAITEAFHVARTGRPGPVLVDIPKDVLQEIATFKWPAAMALPGYRPPPRPHNGQIRAAAQLIRAAQRPVLYVGGGVSAADAAGALSDLATLTRIPVVTTLNARGTFPDSHCQHLGMAGRHGTPAAVLAMQSADLIVALGARFDAQVTGDTQGFAPHATVVHADIDPAEISKNRHADVPIVGDAKEVISELLAALRLEVDNPVDGLPGWWAYLNEIRTKCPPGFDQQADGSLPPEYVIQQLGLLAGPDAVFTAGSGSQQILAANYITYDRPRSWVTSSALSWGRGASQFRPRSGQSWLCQDRPYGLSMTTSVSRSPTQSWPPASPRRSRSRSRS